MVYEIFVNDEFIGFVEGAVSMIEIEDALIKRFGSDAVNVYEFQPDEGWLRLEDVDYIVV